jgi:hydroxymethylglutaryl-CoA lyase
MLERGGFDTGIDLDKMIATAKWLEDVALKHPVESALKRAGGFPKPQA